MLVVYEIFCKANGWRYIGCTGMYYERKREHIRALRKKDHPNKKLIDDYWEFGNHNFVFSVIKERFNSRSDMFTFERNLINSEKMLYNIKEHRKGNSPSVSTLPH